MATSTKTSWQLAEAKNKLSEVVTRALDEEPQRITRRGRVVVVVSEDEYLRLKGEKPDFKEFLLNAPDWSGVDLTRDRTPSRDFEW